MQFIYSADAGSLAVQLESSQSIHLKALRLKAGDEVNLRNLQDQNLYTYLISGFDRKNANLTLISSKEYVRKADQNIHIAWCVVDNKIIEKTLPFLNELGVAKLSLVWCEKSQRNFKLDFARFERILIASCEQSGRSQMMEIELITTDQLVEKYPKSVVLDFGGEKIVADQMRDKTVIIGAEGGFGLADQECFAGFEKVSINSPLILRSESATIFVASVILSI